MFTQKSNETSLSLKKLTEIELQLTEHEDLLGQVTDGLKKLRSRISMRNLRKQRADDEIPDSVTDPQGWKAAMRRQLHMQKLNGGN